MKLGTQSGIRCPFALKARTELYPWSKAHQCSCEAFTSFHAPQVAAQHLKFAKAGRIPLWTRKRWHVKGKRGVTSAVQRCDRASVHEARAPSFRAVQVHSDAANESCSERVFSGVFS